MKPYTMLEHTGDIKIRATGRDLKEVFAHAAKGMMGFLYGEKAVKKFQAEKNEVIEVKSADQESLLVDWLSELLYLSNTHYRLYLGYDIQEIDDHHVKAVVGSAAAQAHDDIKAVTYHELKIEKKDDHFEVVVVFDI